MIHVVPDPQPVSFMYSYPNPIPLPPAAVEGIVQTVMPLEFDRIYSHFSDREITTGAKDAIRRSAERYTRAAGW
ncbi:MAG TPA: hypothetical protein VGR24_11350 [bacterium]|jgi:hypothetical protein|nr:hypothetical protein [bacterium]